MKSLKSPATQGMLLLVLLLALGGLALAGCESSEPTTSTPGPGTASQTTVWPAGRLFGEVTIYSEPQFSEGLAAVAFDQEGSQWGYVDSDGRVVIEPRFERAESFSEGLAAVYSGGWDSGWGYIDKTGAIVIQQQFDEAGPFSEGLALVAVPDHYRANMGYIDRTGKIVIEPQWDMASAFSDGLAEVRVKDKGWGCIDKTGKMTSDDGAGGT